MVQERKALADRIQRWRVVTANLRPDLERFPQLEGNVADLEGMYAEAASLISELTLLRGRLQSATARLRALARRGDMTRTRIGAGLRAALGYESTLLVRYGFRPRRERLAEEGAADPADPAERAGDLGDSEPS